MSSKEKDIIYTAADINQYLSGKMLPRQMHAMEKAALDDPFLAEAMEGYEGMKDAEYSTQLTALHQQIAGSVSKAKVIPLHKKKNNWWKVAVAFFIIGGGTILTFLLLTNDSTVQNTPQAAQTTTVLTDSFTNVNNIASSSVTESLNANASTPAEEIVVPLHGPLAKNSNDKNDNSNFIAEPGAPQLKPTVPGNAGVTDEKDNAVVLRDNIDATSSSSSGQTFSGNAQQRSEEAVSTARNSAAKAGYNMGALTRQKSEAFAVARKEATLNNFFTAHVVAGDDKPLPFTNISIKKENFGTYADAKGIVRLVSTDSILNVEARSVGYVPKTYTLRNNKAPAKIVLQEDETAQKNKDANGNTDANSLQRSRRAILLTNPVANAEPADGWENYNTYVANNLYVPDDLLRRDIRGEVELSFDVKPNGTISNIHIIKSLGAAYDEAAKRLLLEGPQWKVKKGRNTSANIKVQF